MFIEWVFKEFNLKVRKLETDLVQLRDKAKAEEAEKKGDVEKKSSGGETTRKILECQLKDYCKSQRNPARDRNELYSALVATTSCGRNL